MLIPEDCLWPKESVEEKLYANTEKQLSYNPSASFRHLSHTTTFDISGTNKNLQRFIHMHGQLSLFGHYLC